MEEMENLLGDSGTNPREMQMDLGGNNSLKDFREEGEAGVWVMFSNVN